MNKMLCCLLALSCTLLADPAQAATCVVAASGVLFGNYPAGTTADDNSTGTVTLTCTNLLPTQSFSWTIALAAGSSGNETARSMANGSARLGYQLYTNAAHTSVWGDGMAGTVVISGSSTSGVGPFVQSYTVYGDASAMQQPTSGAYADSITVTATFSGAGL